MRHLEVINQQISSIMIRACCILICATVALARTGPFGPTNNYEAPVGLQVGTISQPIKCNATLSGLLVLKNADFELVLGGSFASGVGRNQGFYLTGRAVVTGSLAVTKSLIALNVTSISGTLNSTIILAPGSKNGQYDVAKYKNITVPSQAIVAGKPLVLTLPSSTSTPINIGPIFPNASSSQILIAVGSTVFDTKAVILGHTLPVKVTCPTPAKLSYLAFTVVGGSGTKTIGPNADYKPVTNIPSHSLLGSSGINFVCSITDLPTPFTVPISLTAFSPVLNVTRGKKFQYLYPHATVNISKSIIETLQATLPPGGQAAAFQLEVFSLSTSGTGINPSTVPTLAAPSFSNVTKISASTATYHVDIPGKNGVLPPINYTAASSPGVALIYLGDAKVKIIALTSTGTTLISFNLTCKAPTAPKTPLLPLAIL